jgi:flagellar biogenesis protein FliO
MDSGGTRPRGRCRRNGPRLAGTLTAFLLVALPDLASAETNSVVLTGGEPLSGVGTSVIRVLGALAVTLSVFFAGVWLFRNWQRLVARPGRTPALQLLECRALGGRQSLWVVAYEGQRMLLASSPSGISLIAHLPAAEVSDLPNLPAPSIDFASAFQQVLGRKP